MAAAFSACCGEGLLIPCGRLRSTMAEHRELSGLRIVQEQVERASAGSELGKGGGNGVLARGGDDFEVGAFDAAEFVVEDGDAFVGGDGDGPFDAVVGDDHAEALEGGEDGAGFR